MENTDMYSHVDSIWFGFIIYVFVRRVCVCDYYSDNNSYHHDLITLMERINEREISQISCELLHLCSKMTLQWTFHSVRKSKYMYVCRIIYRYMTLTRAGPSMHTHIVIYVYIVGRLTN